VSKDPANRKKYCFQSPVWAKCIPHVIELRQVFRQKDPEFVRMLRKVKAQYSFCRDFGPKWVVKRDQYQFFGT
jgi:hypothetical protein